MRRVLPRSFLSAVAILTASVFAGGAQAAPVTFNFFGINPNHVLRHSQQFRSSAGGFTVRATAFSNSIPFQINYSDGSAVLYDKDQDAGNTGLGVCPAPGACVGGDEINRQPFQVVRIDLGGLENTLTDFTATANSVEPGLRRPFQLYTNVNEALNLRKLPAYTGYSDAPFSFVPQRYLFFVNGVGALPDANFLLHSISAQASGLAVPEPSDLALFALALAALGCLARRRLKNFR